MKKTIVVLMIAGFALTSTGMVNAADGTVNFTGNIIANACTVTTATANQTVVLGDVATTAFSAAGAKASPTKFNIQLTNCDAAIHQVAIKFDGVSDPTNASLLKLDSGQTATGVGIEISDASGNVIPLHTASATTAISSGAATLNFVGRYVSTVAAVTAGTANGTSQFTLNYQ